MYNNPYFAGSLEARVLSATPVELVQMLYDGAIDAIQSARRHLAEGRIKDRGRSIGQAVAILAELRGSLNHEAGGELSARLGGLYAYLQRILLEANFRQSDEGLAESERLLKTVREGWAQIASQPTADQAAKTSAAEYAAEYATRSFQLCA